MTFHSAPDLERPVDRVPLRIGLGGGMGPMAGVSVGTILALNRCGED
jgi:hypothetical protein